MNHGDFHAPATLAPDPGSFRDRSNRVYVDGDRVLRGIDEHSLASWRRLSEAEFFEGLMQRGQVVRTTELNPSQVEPSGAADWPAFLEHERIPFISYPYEWCFGMLKDAALLHLDILERALEAGWTMKDASAYNVQWIGAHPVFIDTPSFEPHVDGEPWVGYRQFCMMFLYPLMLRAYKDVDYLPFLRSSLEGIDPAMADRILSGATRFRKGVLGHVYLHARMQRKYADRDLNEAASLTEGAGGNGPARRRKTRHSFAMLMGTIQGLQRTVARLNVADSRTTWGNYDSEHSYAATSHDAKQQFVRKHVMAKHRSLAWDLGCNTGTFSRICAENTDYVVAVDGDEKAVDRMYAEQKSSNGTNILPLVMNLGNISPDQGWAGRERRAFDARGTPQLVLCLALIHHIVITANIPLDQFLEWLAKLKSDVVIELVGLEDEMTRMLLRNRVHQYAELATPNFEAALQRLFEVKDTLSLKGGTRQLYYVEPK